MNTQKNAMQKRAVVICPGGAYRHLAPRESAPVARRFAAAGWTPFVMKYSVGENLGTVPLTEAARALRGVREACGIDAFVAVCGFSAGGHLAGSLGVHWDDETLFPNPAERAANRPDAMILSYPVVSGGQFRHAESFRRLTGAEEGGEYFSLEKHVKENTPPTFLWHTATDAAVPVENSLLFAQALWAKRVPCELHVFPRGVHGLSLATPEVDEPEQGRLADPLVARWMDLCLEWLDATAKGRS